MTEDIREWAADWMEGRIAESRWMLGLLEPAQIEGKRLVDLGAGAGALLLAALERGADLAIGVEPDPFVSFYGPERAAAVRAEFYARAAQLPGRTAMLESGAEGVHELLTQADLVTSFDVLEHVPSPREFIQAAHRLLAPGGLFVISTCPYYYSPAGHHFFADFDVHEDPWVHLRRDPDPRLAAARFSPAHWDVFETLNQITHAEIRDVLIAEGFVIDHEHLRHSSIDVEPFRGSLSLPADKPETVLTEEMGQFICRKAI